MKHGSSSNATLPPIPETPSAFLSWSLILLAVFFSYYGAFSARFIWDDAQHAMDKAALQSLRGFLSIWFEPGALQQYYPVTHSAFWLIYHIFGPSAVAFHSVTILFHALNACLLQRLGKRLSLEGSLWLALFFAIHPVNVETVAWVSELKNTLSAFFVFISALAYFRAGGLSEQIKSGWYGLSLLAYVLALGSKTIACSLPVVLLGICWWKSGKLKRSDFWHLTPFMGLIIPAGLLTTWVEENYMGASGTPWVFSFTERLLIAGRALWFYLLKLLWPVGLSFNYPRWKLNIAIASFLPFTLFVGVLLLLFYCRRRIGRAPFTSLFLYTVMIFPALGFFNIYPMRYSFVADHFQYLASVPIIALVVCGSTGQVTRHYTRFRQALTIIFSFLLLGMGLLTVRRVHAFHDSQTLWQDVLTKNPESFLAHNNLALDFYHAGHWNDAEQHFETATRLSSGDAEPRANMALLYERTDRSRQGVPWAQQAVFLTPKDPAARCLLGRLLMRQQLPRKAALQFDVAVQLGEAQLLTIRPGSRNALIKEIAHARGNLGIAELESGHVRKAVSVLEQATLEDRSSTEISVALAQARQKSQGPSPR